MTEITEILEIYENINIYYEHISFLDCIKNSKPAAVSLNDGLQAVAIGEAAEISIKENRIVKMDEFKI